MHYRNNYLSRVAFQANFNIDLLKKGLNQSLADLCRRLSGAEKIEQPVLNITLSMAPNQTNASEKMLSYIFAGDRFHIQIQNTFINIADKHYTHHDDFHNLIIEIFNQFNATYNKPIFTRISLRYANNINFSYGDTFDFANKINPVLLGATLAYRDMALTRSIGVINMHGEDDINVNFTYGYINPEYPNRIAKREFVLDYDCFKIPNENVSDITPILLELRAKVNTLFERSVMQELKDIMEPIN